MSSDWIVYKLGIPAAEVEIGAATEYNSTWMPVSSAIAFKIVEENISWLEHTYNKIGNQITLSPIGFTIKKAVKNTHKATQMAYLHVNITN